MIMTHKNQYGLKLREHESTTQLRTTRWCFDLILLNILRQTKIDLASGKVILFFFLYFFSEKPVSHELVSFSWVLSGMATKSSGTKLLLKEENTFLVPKQVLIFSLNLGRNILLTK